DRGAHVVHRPVIEGQGGDQADGEKPDDDDQCTDDLGVPQGAIEDLVAVGLGPSSAPGRGWGVGGGHVIVGAVLAGVLCPGNGWRCGAHALAPWSPVRGRGSTTT